jgi:hypothetical protein
LHTVVLVWNKTFTHDFNPVASQTVCHIHDVILYDITCIVHPNAFWWPLERKTNEFHHWLCHSVWKSLICTIALTFMVCMFTSGPIALFVSNHMCLLRSRMGHQISTPPFKLMWFFSLTSLAFQVVTTLNST